MRCTEPVLLRRARPGLGTLVELAIHHPERARGEQALVDAFAQLDGLERRLSRFVPDSDIARFNALPAGRAMALSPPTQRVLAAADWLRTHSQGRFDLSMGSGCWDWRLQGGRLCKRADGVQLDLGGIAKGYVVDRLAALLRRAGATAGSVNAGGDLRVFGPDPVPLLLRDEQAGGLREFGHLADGAFASSHYAPGSRSRLQGLADGAAVQVAVAAPSALWADALCKLAGLGVLDPADGERESALLQRLHAQVWTWRRRAP